MNLTLLCTSISLFYSYAMADGNIRGNTFVVISHTHGWWVVQHDPAGAGTVEIDTSKQGWVPAGCLLETRVPVASAMAETSGATDAATNRNPNAPIIPLSIISTFNPGVALADYTAKGEEELDLLKDDLLRVFKRYNHWSYVVREDTGDRGWVPVRDDCL
jgi:protein STE50